MGSLERRLEALEYHADARRRDEEREGAAAVMARMTIPEQRAYVEALERGLARAEERGDGEIEYAAEDLWILERVDELKREVEMERTRNERK
jgi:hypothetical protein